VNIKLICEIRGISERKRHEIGVISENNVNRFAGKRTNFTKTGYDNVPVWN
jgi:hypothetical protein